MPAQRPLGVQEPQGVRPGPEEKLEPHMKDGLVTRRVVAGAAWTVPVTLVGQPAAAAACSPTDVVEFTPVLGVVSTTATKPVNGHTLGTFTWTIRNDGSTTILAGTTYTATFTADKAPGRARRASCSLPSSPRASPCRPRRAPQP